MNPRSSAFEPALSAGLCLVAVAAALVSQHRFDMQPCPWCVLQRLVFILVAAVGLFEATLRWMNPHAWMNAGCTILRIGLALGGLAAALWQHFVAAASASCNLTWADRILAFTRLDAWLPDIFQPRASCLEAKAWLLFVPYELWSAALFVLLVSLAARSLFSSTSA